MRDIRRLTIYIKEFNLCDILSLGTMGEVIKAMITGVGDLMDRSSITFHDDPKPRCYVQNTHRYLSHGFSIAKAAANRASEKRDASQLEIRYPSKAGS